MILKEEKKEKKICVRLLIQSLLSQICQLQRNENALRDLKSSRMNFGGLLSRELGHLRGIPSNVGLQDLRKRNSSNPLLDLKIIDILLLYKYRVSHGKLVFFELAWRDRNMNVRFFWRVFLKS